MKQIITLLLAIIICFSIGIPIAFAAEDSIPDFDYTKLKGKESGFEYDNKTGEWSWQHQCTMKYSDASVTVGFRTMGVTNPDFVCLYAKMIDPNGEKFATVTGIKIVAEDDTFQYKKMMTKENESYVLLGENGNLLIEAIAYCDSEQVSFTIYYDDNYLTLPFDSSMIESTMKTYCLEYVRKGLWLYNRHKDTFERAEELFPLFINGIIADYKTMHKEHSDIIKPITMEEIMEHTAKNTQPTATPSSRKENVTPSFVNSKEEYDIALGTKIGTGIYIGGRDIPVGRYYAVLQGKTSYCDVNIYPSKQDYYDYEKDYSGTQLTSADMSKNGSNCCMFEIIDGYLLSVEHDGIIAWKEIPITEIQDETIVPMGIYQGGRDIPSGRYSVQLFPNTRWAYIRTFTDYQNFVDYRTNYSGELLFTGTLNDPNDECVFELADGEILYIEGGDLYATPANALIFK